MGNLGFKMGDLGRMISALMQLGMSFEEASEYARIAKKLRLTFDDLGFMHKEEFIAFLGKVAIKQKKWKFYSFLGVYPPNEVD